MCYVKCDKHVCDCHRSFLTLLKTLQKCTLLAEHLAALLAFPSEIQITYKTRVQSQISFQLKIIIFLFLRQAGLNKAAEKHYGLAAGLRPNVSEY